MGNGFINFLKWMNTSQYAIATVTAVMLLIPEIFKYKRKVYCNMDKLLSLKNISRFKNIKSVEIGSINKTFFVFHVVLLVFAWLFMLFVDAMIGLFGFIFLNSLIDTLISPVFIRKLGGGKSRVKLRSNFKSKGKEGV